MTVAAQSRALWHPPRCSDVGRKPDDYEEDVSPLSRKDAVIQACWHL